MIREGLFIFLPLSFKKQQVSKIEIDYNNIDSIIRYITEEDSLIKNPSLDTKALSDSNPQFLPRLRIHFDGDDQNIKKFLKFLNVLKKFKPEEYQKIVHCCTETYHLVCPNGHAYEIESSCHSKYCPFCSRARSFKYRAILKSFLKNRVEGLPLRYMTLTWRNTLNLTDSLRKKYHRDFKNFKQKLKRMGYDIIKGVKCTEVKYHARGSLKYDKKGNVIGRYDFPEYNTHLHLLYYAKYNLNKKTIRYRDYFTKHNETDGYVKQSFLSDIWRDITGDSYIVDIQRISKGFRGGVNYLCKYFTKSEDIFDISLDKLIEYDRFRKNLRIIEKFGFKRADTLSDHKLVCLCPVCNVRVKIDRWNEVQHWEYMPGRVLVKPLCDVRFNS